MSITGVPGDLYSRFPQSLRGEVYKVRVGIYILPEHPEVYIPGSPGHGGEKPVKCAVTSCEKHDALSISLNGAPTLSLTGSLSKIASDALEGVLLIHDDDVPGNGSWNVEMKILEGRDQDPRWR